MPPLYNLTDYLTFVMIDYAAHCIDLMLSDVGDLSVHKNKIVKAQKLTMYVYCHSLVLNLRYNNNNNNKKKKKKKNKTRN